MYTKTAIILLWTLASYLWLVFFTPGIIGVILLSLSLGLALTGIGFNIMHDGGHEAYSRSRYVNKLAAWTLDLIGTSSYRWHWKHNRIHHTYTNIVGVDDDIELWPIARMAPQQQRFWFHRFQHFYIWGFYGFLLLKMHWWDDVHDLILGRIGTQKMPRPKGKDLAVAIAGKLTFMMFAFGIPLLMHPVLGVLACYLFAAFTMGVVLSVVFQLAHCVEGVEMKLLEVDGAMTELDTEWSRHQVETTADFAPHSRILDWYLGGLNFQTVHHLFPKICHVHYRKIRPLIEEVCKEQGLPYTVYPGIFSALGGHYRWLRALGQPEAA